MKRYKRPENWGKIKWINSRQNISSERKGMATKGIKIAQEGWIENAKQEFAVVSYWYSHKSHAPVTMNWTVNVTLTTVLLTSIQPTKKQFKISFKEKRMTLCAYFIGFCFAISTILNHTLPNDN